MSKTLTTAQIQKVVGILTAARMDNGVKLRFGYRKRDSLLAEIRAETKISDDNYRYKWLKDTRNKLVEVVGAQGQEFNKAYPHDRISLQDFLDALNSASLLIKAKMNE